MTTAYLTALSNAFQEKLVPGIKDLMIRNDPIFENVVDSSSRVSKDPLSKDYRIYYSYTSSLAGGMQFHAATAAPMRLAGTDRANILTSLTAFPGIADSAIPSVARYSIGMTSVRGNIYLPFAATQANELNGPPLDDIPALTMKKSIEMIAHTMAVSWYATVNGGIARINTSSGNITTTLSDTNVITLTSNTGDLIADGRIRCLKPGMYVDLYANNFGTKLNANGFCLVIGAVNNQNGTSSIKLYFESGTDATSADTEANIAGYWFCPRGAVVTTATTSSRLPCGYQSFVISSGKLFGYAGDLTDITTVPELMSVTASLSGDLTEQVLNKYISLYNDAIDGDMDTFFTSAGVVLNLLDAPTTLNQAAYQRQGDTLKVRLGWDGLDYTYDGKKYKIYQSPYITKGHFLGLKLGGGNIKRFYPPTVPGTGTNAGFAGSVRWIGPMFGKNIWMPTLNTDAAVTEGMQAPYMIDLQMGADDPRGLLLTSCTDDSIGA